MEPDIEGNDNAMMHLVRGEVTKTFALNVNQLTSLELTINQIIELTRNEGTRNTHE